MNLAQIHDRLADHCEDIAQLFKPGSKVTILVRHTKIEDGDVVVTADDLGSVMAAIARLQVQGRAAGRSTPDASPAISKVEKTENGRT